jgi:protein associated with RNAse G/E
MKTIKITEERLIEIFEYIKKHREMSYPFYLREVILDDDTILRVMIKREKKENEH